MSSWLLRSVRPLIGSCLVVLLLIAGTMTASAQSTMDPSIDSDNDGINNQRDFDDDNDLVADDVDCAPFDPAIGRDCPTPTPRPADPTPTPRPADPTVSNQEADNDGDGIADRVDPDDDNDGIVDELDSAPFDASVGTAPTPSIIDHEEDSDGDGIANSHDPDDDNDGVQDDQDSHPFDPTRGEKPPPSVIDPRTDSDGDGIANSHDPDDDNDGVVDELDCAPFDVSVSACPDAANPGAGGNTGGSSGDASGSDDVVGTGGGNGPLVTSLPVTGTGEPDSAVGLAWVLAAIVALVAGATLALAGLRGWLRPMRVPARADQRRR
jgi:hypothetical protein